MEHRLANASDKDDDEDKDVAEMRRKLQAAKLVSRRVPMVTVLVGIKLNKQI